jgi:hypothetical protein
MIDEAAFFPLTRQIFAFKRHHPQRTVHGTIKTAIRRST